MYPYTFIPTDMNPKDTLFDKKELGSDFRPWKSGTPTPFEALEKKDLEVFDFNRNGQNDILTRREDVEELRNKVSEDLEDYLEQYSVENVHDLIPRNGGRWEGKPGDSEWKPGRDEVPPKYNPEGKTWGEILDEYGIDSIEFKDGEPDFSKISRGTVEIEGFSDQREGPDGNYAKADQKLADQWNIEGKDGRTDWTAKDVEAYRKDNNLTWHERSDMKTMDLVPTIVHSNIPHSGGVSEVKKQNDSNESGENNS